MLTTEDLRQLLKSLVDQKSENKWVEFKRNFHSPEELGGTISALSNGACLHNQSKANLVFGVENESYEIIGSSFKPKSENKKRKIRKLDLPAATIAKKFSTLHYHCYFF